jgi:hypothetical protein
MIPDDERQMLEGFIIDNEETIKNHKQINKFLDWMCEFRDDGFPILDTDRSRDGYGPFPYGTVISFKEFDQMEAKKLLTEYLEYLSKDSIELRQELDKEKS